ncbi:MAG: polysaccharide deacetylase family protein [Trebonia sp.]
MTVAPPLRVPVLMYHEIADGSVTDSPLAVSPSAFADHIAYLRDAGFATVAAGELATVVANHAGALPDKPVVLTFDDGYGDFYTQALPLLQGSGYSATLFQTTGWVGERDKAKRMMNWRELAESEQAGIEIGAHTCTHPQLDQLAEGSMREELYVSKSLLEDNLGLRVPGLAYPYGYSNARVRRMARELGYDYGYAVGNAMATSDDGTFTLPRFTVRHATSMDEFRKIVNGKDTLTLRRDRALTSGYSLVRRVRSAFATRSSSAR